MFSIALLHSVELLKSLKDELRKPFLQCESGNLLSCNRVQERTDILAAVFLKGLLEANTVAKHLLVIRQNENQTLCCFALTQNTTIMRTLFELKQLLYA